MVALRRYTKISPIKLREAEIYEIFLETSKMVMEFGFPTLNANLMEE